RDEKAARTAERRLEVASEALIGVVTSAQAVGVGMELWKDRIEFADPDRWRAISKVRTGVAGRLQLPGTSDPRVEGAQFIGVDRCAGGRVGTDGRRVRDRNSPLLQCTSRVRHTAADAGIYLRESWYPQ